MQLAITELGTSIALKFQTLSRALKNIAACTCIVLRPGNGWDTCSTGGAGPIPKYLAAAALRSGMQWGQTPLSSLTPTSISNGEGSSSDYFMNIWIFLILESIKYLKETTQMSSNLISLLVCPAFVLGAGESRSRWITTSSYSDGGWEANTCWGGVVKRGNLK